MAEHSAPDDMNLAAPGMLALLAAQFLSALADNAVLIAAIALLKAAGQPDRSTWLQAAFVIPFILLAPWLGRLADAFPKGRVMLAANGLKLAGAAALLAGMAPVPAYALIGLGAAAYSPAKYGILSQMFSPGKLVKANGLLEASTIVAILLGVVLGGLLADRSIDLALTAILACYALAGLINLAVPNLPPERRSDEGLLEGARRFMGLARKLLGNGDARFSLFGTAIFWGSGATLRLMLFAWVPLVLGIADNGTPSQLMGALSVGIVLGAGAAGLGVSLERVNRALWGGLLLGPLILVLSVVHDLTAAFLVMAAIGACGGYFVVPLNALLQKRGHESIGAGQALAVQNFLENLAMLAGVAFYALANKLAWPVTTSAAVFGTAVLVCLAGLAFSRRQGDG